jgi:hypothetical protein
MSWHWSRLSILVFLGLLYVSPLSSGDKGLWLSVTAMPVQLFGAIPSRMPPEHSVLLPDRGGLGLAMARVEQREPALSPGVPPDANGTVYEGWEQFGHTFSWNALEGTCPAPFPPRGPPV